MSGRWGKFRGKFRGNRAGGGALERGLSAVSCWSDGASVGTGGARTEGGGQALVQWGKTRYERGKL